MKKMFYSRASRTKTSRFILMALLYSGLSSCQISSERPEMKDAESTQRTPPPGKIDPKYSLTADRQKFDELRAEIPPSQKVQNDEKALYTDWMAGVTTEPAVVREKFENVVRRKREEFNKDMTRLREKYGREEKASREKLTREIETERAELKEQSLKREDRQQKMSELDQKRRDYYSSEREQRDLFESDVRTARKDFEDYLKQRSDEFNSEYKSYLIRWKEKKSNDP